MRKLVGPFFRHLRSILGAIEILLRLSQRLLRLADAFYHDYLLVLAHLARLGEILTARLISIFCRVQFFAHSPEGAGCIGDQRAIPDMGPSDAERQPQNPNPEVTPSISDASVHFAPRCNADIPDLA